MGHHWLMRDRTLDRPAFRARRLHLKLTLGAAAAAAGVSVSYLKYLESDTPPKGRTTLVEPSDRVMRDLATAYDCTVDDLTTPKDGKATGGTCACRGAVAAKGVSHRTAACDTAAAA
jgi:transcriptional regulator with XRE-family HTH domain